MIIYFYLSHETTQSNISGSKPLTYVLWAQLIMVRPTVLALKIEPNADCLMAQHGM